MAFAHLRLSSSELATAVAALAVGPLFAYLAWAILKRRPAHVAVAASLNVAFWIVMPALIAHSVGVA